MTTKEEKVKKQKKEKKTEIKTENIIKTHKEEMQVDISENNDIKKKKKKRKLATDCVNDDVNGDPDAGVSKKKKKKKRLVEDDGQIESVQTLVKEELMKRRKEKKKKNEKKVKNKSLQTESYVEIVKIEKVENVDAENLQEKKTSKKAKKVKNQVAETEEKDKKKKTKWTAEEDFSVNEKMTTKKSIKNKSKLPVNGVNIDLSESDQIQNVNMKKKKAKDKLIAKESKEITNKVKKDKNKVASNCEKEKSEEKHNHDKKKKHKKSKPESVIDIVVDRKKIKKAQDFVDITDYSGPKKKKKKKISEESDKEPLLLECEIEEVATNKGKQKKRSKKMEIKVDTGADTGTKKKQKKIKEERVDQEESSQVEVVFLSEKAGNTDEVNINQERRQALQMEIDQASQPQKPAKPSGLGQWSTAEFGSSEQQQKFLRLMGGFKKGFQPASSSSGSGSMALGKDDQQQLQQGLMGEFERAHSRRMDFSNRGAGLGFTAQSKKKFSIDVNATRSIHFDD